MAIAEETDAGKPGLFVRTTGSDKVTPRQGKLCTNDGRLAEDVQEPVAS